MSSIASSIQQRWFIRMLPRPAEQQPLHIGEREFSGMTTVTLHREEGNGLQRIVWAAASGSGLALAALVSYEVTTRILSSAISSRDDQMLGGMWSVVATLFVCRESYKESVSAALSRTAATSLSFILCLGYLLLLPFSSSGMTILIAIGAVILGMIERPGDIITTSITTAVVMVVAGISPKHAWSQPILRLSDTLIGIAVGIAAASTAGGLHNLSHFHESIRRTEKSQWKITTENL
jgi:Fusaric acid resistance protein-like